MISTALKSQLDTLSFPTLGHFLEEGFCTPHIQHLAGTRRMIGRAATARVHDNDALTVNAALERLRPGEVLFIEMADDHLHAPIGSITRAHAVSRGAAGIVVDGPVTDIAELCQSFRGHSLPVYGRGTTCLTTKRHDAVRGEVGVPIVVGGTLVRPGDIALGDENGVVVLPETVLVENLPAALDSDAAESALLAAFGEALVS